MRLLMIVIFALAVLWSGYWFVGSRAVERGAELMLDQLSAEGWDVQVADVSTVGFPNRFDTTATDIQLTGPYGDVRWAAPFFQVFALSYKPNHVIAALPDSQSVEIAGQRFDVTSDGFLGSLVLAPNTALTLERVRLAAASLAIAAPNGAEVRLSDARIATRPGPAPEVHELGISAQNIELPAEVLRALNPGRTLPQALDGAALDLFLTFDGPLDRHALASPRGPQVERLEIASAGVTWGDIALSLAGALDVGADGLLNGALTLETAQWEQIADMLAQPGVLPDGAGEGVRSMAQSLAAADGTPDVLTAPITFRNGQMFMGLFPLGPAPRI